MASTKFTSSTILIIVLCCVGYVSGFFFGNENGMQAGIEIGKQQEIADIKSKLWNRELNVSSVELDDSVLVIIRQFMYPSDRTINRVGMESIADLPGLHIKKKFDSGYHRMSGTYYDSIWQLKNNTKSPIEIGDASFTNLPPNFKIDQRFHQEDIIVKPSEQAGASNGG